MLLASTARKGRPVSRLCAPLHDEKQNLSEWRICAWIEKLGVPQDYVAPLSFDTLHKGKLDEMEELALGLTEDGQTQHYSPRCR